MKQHNQSFDHLLWAYFTKTTSNNMFANISEKEADLVFAKTYEDELPQDKKEEMISSLSKSLSKETLGALVEQALSKEKDMERIYESTGLTNSILTDIKSDAIFVNSIPIKSLAKLFMLLNIPFEKAKSAIIETYERLSFENTLFVDMPTNLQPVFKKGKRDSSNLNIDLSKMNLNQNFLFQNKDALEKYLNRLNELYLEMN